MLRHGHNLSYSLYALSQFLDFLRRLCVYDVVIDLFPVPERHCYGVAFLVVSPYENAVRRVRVGRVVFRGRVIFRRSRSGAAGQP